MNGHDEETYERKDLPTAFVPREEYEKLERECEHLAKRQYLSDNYYNGEMNKLKEALKELIPIAQWGYDLLVPFDKKGMGKNWPTAIENARKLLTHQPNDSTQ